MKDMQASQSLITSENETVCSRVPSERTTFLARQNLPEDKGCVYTDTFFPPAENTGRSFVNAQLGVFESASKAQHFFFFSCDALVAMIQNIHGKNVLQAQWFSNCGVRSTGGTQTTSGKV